MINRLIRMTALAVTFALVTAANAFAVDLKWAHVYEEGSDYHKWALWAADEVKKKTDGRVNIAVFPASSLGKEVEINEGLGIGAVDFIYTGPSFVERYYGPIAISDYPFIMRGYDHWIPRTYPMSPAELADLLNRWRDRAG